MPEHHSAWCKFIDLHATALATGTFLATGTDRIGRLYFPLANEAGALSWTSPHLHGGLAISHDACLSPPLTAEDLPHTLVRREFWIIEEGRAPFALSGMSPDGLAGRQEEATIEAGPGWFSLTRGRRGRFEVTATLWCPADLNAAVEIMRVDVRNISSLPLTFHPYAAIPMFARSADNLRDHRHVTALLHRIAVRRDGVTVRPTMSFDERGHAINHTRYSVFAAGPRGAAPAGVWGVEEEFVGEGGTLAAPAAVWKLRRAPATRRAARAGKEAIGAFRFAACTLRPGQRAEYALVSGISQRPQDFERWGRWARKPGALARSLARTQTYWRQAAQGVAFRTGARTLDQWLTWVNVQPTLRRLYGNSYLPQFDYGRGGRGWRDLWQDSLALLLSDPARTRPMLLHNFGGVRMDGSNATIIGQQGAFIADRNNIPRTWMDHGAWPTHSTLLYVDQTGDLDFLLEPREYFRDPQLLRCRQQDPGWSERQGFQLRTRAGRVYRGTILEHLLVQNLTAFFNVGEHNICRLEGADWNDGLDMAAARGESVAFSAFYAWNLGRLADLADVLAARGVGVVVVAEELAMLLDRLPGRRRVAYASARAKQARLAQYLDAVSRDISGRTIRVRLADLARDARAKRDDLARRISTQEWIAAGGEAFFNGYYDNAGQRVDGAHPKGVRMALTGQVFALMSGIVSEPQADRTIRAVNRWLRDARSGGIRLNTDFGELQPDLGRAFSFAYGEKENGAVFSHMAVMYASALYRRRRAAEGRKVWSALYRMATNQPVARIFPCLPEYFNAEGRGMYCYLTGSASWLIYLLLTQVYGIRGELGDLAIDPQLTRDDFGTQRAVGVHVAFAQRPLRIEIRNPHQLDAGAYRVTRVEVNGAPQSSTILTHGGVRLSRRQVTRLPAHRTATVRVLLGPRR